MVNMTFCGCKSLYSLPALVSRYKDLLEKWFPLQGEQGHSLKILVCTVRTLGFKNKERKKRRRRENNNRTINLPQGNNILHILHVHHLTLNFIIHNKYISALYLYIYIHTYTYTRRVNV